MVMGKPIGELEPGLEVVREKQTSCCFRADFRGPWTAACKVDILPQALLASNRFSPRYKSSVLDISLQYQIYIFLKVRRMDVILGLFIIHEGFFLRN